ncbi:hypothetical protein [Bradyrhizobium sp. ARR65]|uniref:hypothetical protein n=1 Tax=Bradyrhizobium sp. ARR65 TaxID=1040989 RepID=UPI00046749F1|nr:hypothetical protein [Bradyrhizobium sp. ARR65]
MGRIYQVLEFGREDKAYDPLRDLVGSFIRTRLAVGPGDVVFGKLVDQRDQAPPEASPITQLVSHGKTGLTFRAIFFEIRPMNLQP